MFILQTEKLDRCSKFLLDDFLDLQGPSHLERLEVPEEVQLSLILIRDLKLELLDLIGQLEIRPLQCFKLTHLNRLYNRLIN